MKGLEAIILLAYLLFVCCGSQLLYRNIDKTTSENEAVVNRNSVGNMGNVIPWNKSLLNISRTLNISF